MKQIQFGHYGEPKDVVAVVDQPLPEPGANQVRVRILLSPINPSDLLYLRGHYSGVIPAFPARVGFEGVGVVDALQTGVHNLAVGQRVLAPNSQGGNWADYAVIPSAPAPAVPGGHPRRAGGVVSRPGQRDPDGAPRAGRASRGVAFAVRGGLRIGSHDHQAGPTRRHPHPQRGPQKGGGGRTGSASAPMR